MKSLEKEKDLEEFNKVLKLNKEEKMMNGIQKIPMLEV